MRSLTCIVCPVGCSLDVDDSEPENISVTGNRCQRGTVYALEEIRAPKRVVTATVRIEGSAGSVRRVPVRTSSPCPREKIPELLNAIYSMIVPVPVMAGDIVIAGWDEGIDVVATRTIDK
ncbi:MAG: DUF1667 domain-containing protein [Treponema sp.]|nr:DUF1667 domain-containing protein [Treponema sp.]